MYMIQNNIKNILEVPSRHGQMLGFLDTVLVIGGGETNIIEMGVRLIGRLFLCDSHLLQFETANCACHLCGLIVFVLFVFALSRQISCRQPLWLGIRGSTCDVYAWSRSTADQWTTSTLATCLGSYQCYNRRSPVDPNRCLYAQMQPNFNIMTHHFWGRICQFQSNQQCFCG